MILCGSDVSLRNKNRTNHLVLIFLSCVVSFSLKINIDNNISFILVRYFNFSLVGYYYLEAKLHSICYFKYIFV